MSDSFEILVDSGSDITPELAEKAGIKLFPLSFSVDGKEAPRGKNVDIKKFYGDMRNGSTVTTAAANFAELCAALSKSAAYGHDVLYIAFSSGLSSTAGTARLAVDEVSEKYPNRKIITVDSLSASLGYGLLAYLAAKERDKGSTIEETAKFVEETRLRLCHWFTVDDLFFLKRGGRVSATTAVVGTMLAIKPVLHVDNEGHLINVAKARGRRASLDALCEKMANTAIDPESQTVFISHGDSEEDAKYVEEKIRSRLGVKDIYTGYIGPVIGAHSGPGTVALFFLGRER